jgi:hypothetical protein
MRRILLQSQLNLPQYQKNLHLILLEKEMLIDPLIPKGQLLQN